MHVAAWKQFAHAHVWAMVSITCLTQAPSAALWHGQEGMLMWMRTRVQAGIDVGLIRGGQRLALLMA